MHLRDSLYRHRVAVERTIDQIKNTFDVGNRRSINVKTLRDDAYLARIIQLLGVMLAKALYKPHLYKSIHKLAAG